MKETNWRKTLQLMRIMAIVLALLSLAAGIIDQMVARNGFHIHPVLVLPLIAILLIMVTKPPVEKTS